LLKDCVANFDLVDELGQSVENWINQTLPSSSRISEVILHIAKFIAEFCVQFESSPPPFLRLGIDRKCFAQFHVPLDLHTELAADQQQAHSSAHVPSSAGGGGGASLSPSPTPATESAGTNTEQGAGTHLTVGSSLMVLTKREAHLYHYYRWMWIQFPWLAMPAVSRHLSDDYAAHIAQRDAAVLNHAGAGGGGSPRITINSNTSRGSSLMSPVKVSRKSSHFRNEDKGGVEDEITDASTSSPLLSSPIKKSSAAAVTSEETKRREIATRSWQAKKMDPSLGPISSPSHHRTAALVKSRSISPYALLLTSPLPSFPQPHRLFAPQCN
jgi:hypothetical protein